MIPSVNDKNVRVAYALGRFEIAHLMYIVSKDSKNLDYLKNEIAHQYTIALKELHKEILNEGDKE